MKEETQQPTMIADRRRRLLVAARHLIEAGHSENLSMRRLAAETGTSPATAYNIFGSKAAILVELLQEDRLVFQKQVSAIKASSPLEKIFKSVTIAVGIYRSNTKFHIYIMQQYFSTTGSEIRLFVDKRRHSLWLPLIDEYCQSTETMGLTSDAITSYLEDVYVACLSHWALNERSIESLEGEMGLGFALALRGVTSTPDNVYFQKKIEKYSRLIAKSAKQQRT